MSHLPSATLEQASQLDLLLCHSLEKLLQLTDGLVVNSDASIRRKTKIKAKTSDHVEAIPWVVLWKEDNV